MSQKYKIVVVGFSCLLLGFLIGKIFSSETADVKSKTENKVEQIWTCSMHPQIRQSEPGNCPICGMELIPLKENEDSDHTIQLSQSAIELSNIRTSEVEMAKPEKEIRLQGKIKLDERRLSSQSAHVNGRIEKLYITFTGENVVAGQRLATIYSPELVTAQRELLEAAKYKSSNPIIYEAARKKLLQWELSEKQIQSIEESGVVQKNIDIRAEVSGVVIKRNVSAGNHVKAGDVLFQIADLKKVWVVFEAYESDISWLNIGDDIRFTVGALAGQKFDKKISFIDPLIDPMTRTMSVRLEMQNQDHKLKPEMFVDGIVNAKLPIEKDQLIIPKSAVLWTGKRSIVYVKVPKSEGVFEFREVNLGPDLGSHYLVESGLSHGERVVTYGAFKVDAAAQLAGKLSMMNPGEENEKMDDHKQMGDHKVDKFFVSGNCEMCQARIEKAAESVKGVFKASWDVKSKMLTVHFTHDISLEIIGKAIAKAGHDNEFEPADEKAYNALPKCCLYEKN